MPLTPTHLPSKPTVVFLDVATIPEHINIPNLTFEHQWQQFDLTSPELVVERIHSADIVITNKVKLTAEVLSQAPNLKMIAVAATGTNNVDLEYCRDHNIVVTNVQGYGTRSVPEHVLAMMFALKRNLVGYHQDIAAGEWQKQKQFCFFTHPITDVAGSTLGIIGSGSLGQAVAVLAKAVGMNVVFTERKGVTPARLGYMAFDKVIKTADVLTLHCPLNEETTNLIAKPEFEKMKSSAVLINAGRGGLVNEFDLVEALKNKQIAGAGCDVFTQEPADESNPLIANMDLPNLLLTPHVAWGSQSSIQALCNILMDNIEKFQQGVSQNRVVG
ncbi:D-2-hydroxyacid dehydrogenase [Vibrio rumoiensis]|uniref:Glycerate dehydrogenase n=1 Tax=Vibrio rumoiensis 1S-45 TaxID=1188252 RepID=A0A1E5DYV3_9VIBR|nr:D-2-hydroxyacid dehydrogenase [Vibrio rumoiensis]OEF22986.1 glycerate dehydrogenase [Vibrio rumoiensis 1S-45]